MQEIDRLESLISEIVDRKIHIKGVSSLGELNFDIAEMRLDALARQRERILHAIYKVGSNLARTAVKDLENE